ARFDNESFKSSAMGALVFDMTLKERAWDKADELVKQGHLLMPADLVRAEACFRQALALSKHHPEAWYNLGVCRERARDAVGAVRCFEHALEYNPKLIQAWNNLGSIYAM